MKRRVIVVGAGCAGLSATYTLRKQGVDVVALEAVFPIACTEGALMTGKAAAQRVIAASA